jgi:succinoglycan biosynthesis transport protein ExoP
MQAAASGRNRRISEITPEPAKTAGPEKPVLPESPEREFTLRDYLDIALRRKWVIVASTLAVLSAVVLYLLFKQPVYQSTATFMIEKKDNLFDEIRTGEASSTQPALYYETIMGGVQFQSQLADSIRKSLPPKNEREKPYREDDIIRTVEKLNITGVEKEDLLTLTARTHDRRMSYVAALKASELLKFFCLKLEQEGVQNAVNFIELQKQKTLLQTEDAEKALQTFKKKSAITGGVITFEDGATNQVGIIDQLNRLETELTDIQTQKQLAAANLQAYQNRLNQMQGRMQAPATAEPPEAGRLRQDIADLEAMHEAASAATDKGRLEREIEDKKRSLVALLLKNAGSDTESGNPDEFQAQKSLQESRIREDLNVFVLENKERYYNQKIREFKAQHPNLTDTAVEYMRLLRSKTVSENLYIFLLQKGEESKIKAATSTGGIRMVDPPALPLNRVPMGLKKKLMAALVFGLGLGFGLAYLLDHLNHTVKSCDDITRMLGITVMGQIPTFAIETNGLKKMKPAAFFKKAKPEEEPGNAQLITSMGSKSAVMEAYRMLRANLVFADVDKQMRTLVISSPLPSDGKSVTSANLAIAFALLGEKVILVDADLRKPMQHKMFKIQAQPGLSDLLVGNVHFETVLKSGGVPNLSVIPVGKAPPNPSEVLASQRMEQVIEQLRRKAKIVIFDTPPILPVSDAVILGSKVDGLLLVLRHEQTLVDAARDSVERLHKSGTRIVGAVLNYVMPGMGYGYYKYYGKYYHSYYSEPEKK